MTNTETREKRVSVVYRDRVCRGVLISHGVLWHRVAIFRPFHGIEVHRILRRDVLDPDTAAEMKAFQDDPLETGKTKKEKPA